MQKKWKITITAIIIILIAIIGCTIWYAEDYYHADSSVNQYFNKSGNVSVIETDEGLFVDGPGNESAVIFYQGAKVEHTAYLPGAYKLASKGVDCFLIDMPFKLAFFGEDKTDNIIKNYNYTQWYMAGHSLGGLMGANYASEHNTIEGVILLAGYSTYDLKNKNLKVLSIYGTKDTKLNLETYKENIKNLPSDYTEYLIKGGNHAQYGNYGFQEGDSKASISADKQQTETVDVMVKFILGN